MQGPTFQAGCIFCRIVRKEVPSHQVFESEHALVFMDINPLAPGHLVIVPKYHAEFLHDLPADWMTAVARLFGPLGQAALKATGAPGYNLLQNNGEVAGQAVPHVHFHIVPRRANDGLGFIWRTQIGQPHELADMANRIRAGISLPPSGV